MIVLFQNKFNQKIKQRDTFYLEPFLLATLRLVGILFIKDDAVSYTVCFTNSHREQSIRMIPALHVKGAMQLNTLNERVLTLNVKRIPSFDVHEAAKRLRSQT